MLAMRARLLIACLWAGSLWAVGYLVAPTLFITLPDQVLAGTIAGKLFRVEAWLSVVCGIVLITLCYFHAPDGRLKKLLVLSVGMLLCTLVGYFGIQPFMASLREATVGGVITTDAKTQFGILHGVASGIYFIQSLLGVALVLFNQH